MMMMMVVFSVCVLQARSTLVRHHLPPPTWCEVRRSNVGATTAAIITTAMLDTRLRAPPPSPAQLFNASDDFIRDAVLWKLHFKCNLLQLQVP